MTSLLPQIEEFNSIPYIHEVYAKAILKLMIDKLLIMEKFEIGTYNDNRGSDSESGSIIGFDSDDFEHVLVELRCVHYNYFCIRVVDNTEDFEDSIFKYKISEDSPMEKMLPEKLVAAMKQIDDNEEGMFS